MERYESKVGFETWFFDIVEHGLNVLLVLDPIDTKGLTAADVDNLTRDTREKMLNTITSLAQDKASLSAESKKTS